MAPSWLSGPRTDVPAELPSHRPWVYNILQDYVVFSYIKIKSSTFKKNKKKHQRHLLIVVFNVSDK